MPDVHIARHGGRWAVSEAPGDTPFFESATRAEAEAEARRFADGGRLHWAAEAADDGDADLASGDATAAGDDAPDPGEQRPDGAPARSGEAFRMQQAGL